ncbi:hypothetical protein [Pyrococcus yayanosii]|uniref:hypothetical protein n=1 Tax=Pyrococcus yayanosii TaxID=1008460 RepID=UPI001ED94BC7|nr:hypothetical protein [Pyrococcus yayanosii]
MSETSVTVTVVSNAGVYYVGSAISHEGSDLLCVVPAEVYVPKTGIEVTLNVTVKFKHAQPCPCSDWQILTENPKNVEVIDETETELKDPYTAFKQYVVKVLGNGTLDVVFKYGSECPYGSEERVTIKFYVGTPTNEVLSNASAQTQLPELNTTEKIVEGVVQEVNVDGRYFVIDGTTFAVRGKWIGPNGEEYTWREMLSLIKVGEKVKVRAVYEDGEWKAVEIVINGEIFTKG